MTTRTTRVVACRHRRCRRHDPTGHANPKSFPPIVYPLPWKLRLFILSHPRSYPLARVYIPRAAKRQAGRKRGRKSEERKEKDQCEHIRREGRFVCKSTQPRVRCIVYFFLFWGEERRLVLVHAVLWDIFVTAPWLWCSRVWVYHDVPFRPPKVNRTTGVAGEETSTADRFRSTEKLAR